MKLGETIRTLRLEHKMTQEQLADRLGVSYQSVSRWENQITYPDIELLPALARCFAVSVDALLGGNNAEKEQSLQQAVSRVSEMQEDTREALIDLVRACRREANSNALFSDICYALRYSPLYKDSTVLTELRKSADLFFETCTDAALRSQTLEWYVCLEEEPFVRTLLERYATEQSTAKDFLLKARYLFRDEFDCFDTTRQRFLHKQLCNLIDGDMDLWHGAAVSMSAEDVLFENRVKLALLHNLCDEMPTVANPITCGNAPDVFVAQRIFLGERFACAYAALGKIEEAYAALEDVATLLERVMNMEDGATLCCASPSLATLKVIVNDKQFKNSGHAKELSYIIENGKHESFAMMFLNSELESIATADYGYFGWLAPMRKEARFVDLVKRLQSLA